MISSLMQSLARVFVVRGIENERRCVVFTAHLFHRRISLTCHLSF